ncbi:MAG: uracil-DNA glycosylase [Bacteroidia bacterium]|jgi:uracil-DNA glycosylase
MRDLPLTSLVSPVEIPRVPAAWVPVLEASGAMEALKVPLGHLRRALDNQEIVYPQPGNLFRALELLPPEGVRVVIMGQDPYHSPGLATGLCFAVADGVPPPPSLVNIAKALVWDQEACLQEGREDAMTYPVAWLKTNSTRESPLRLEDWAQQGVLLLNETLTVSPGKPASHRNWGWGTWTTSLLEGLVRRGQPMVWLLWGKEAQKHRNPRVHCLESVHPSPLSAYRGFLHCRHFSQANLVLRTYL